MISESIKKRLNELGKPQNSQTTQSGFSASAESRIDALRPQLDSVRASMENERAAIEQRNATQPKFDETLVESGREKYESDRKAYQDIVAPYSGLNAGEFGWKLKAWKKIKGIDENRAGWDATEDRYIKDMDETTLNRFYQIYNTDPESGLNFANEYQKLKAQQTHEQSEKDSLKRFYKKIGATNKDIEDITDEDLQVYDEALGAYDEVLKTGASAVSMVYTPIDLIATGVDYAKGGGHFSKDVAAGNTMPFTSMGNQFKSEVSQDIIEATPGLNTKEGGLLQNLGIKNWANLLYDVGYSSAQSALIMGTFKEAGLVFFGTSAAASTLQESLNKGDSEEAAMAKAFISGVVEVLTEKVSFEQVLKAKNAKGIVTKIANVLKAGVAEASEEGISEISNYLADILLSGDESEFAKAKAKYLSYGGKYAENATGYALAEWLPDFAYSNISGFLSGLLMQGGAMSIQDVAANASARSTIAESKASGEYADLIESLNASDYMEGKKPLTEASKKRDVVKAYRGATESIEQSSIKDRLMQETTYAFEGEAEATAKAIYDKANDYALSAEQKRLLGSQAAQKVLTEYTEGKKKPGTHKWVDRAVLSQQYATRSTKGESMSSETELGAELRAEEKARKTEAELSARESALKVVSEQIGIDVKTLASQNINMPVETYENNLELAYSYGRAGYKLEDVARKLGTDVSGVFGEAYQKGLEAYKSRSTEKSLRTKLGGKVNIVSQSELDKLNTRAIKETGQNPNYTEVNLAEMKKSNPMVYSAMEMVAKVYAPSVGRQVNFFSAENGVNGWRDASGIWINTDGVFEEYGKKGNVLGFFVHEFGHDLRADAPELFEEARQIIIDSAYKGNADALTKAAEGIILERGGDTKVDLEGAVEELVCDGLVKLTEDKEMLDKAFRTENLNFWKRFKKFLDSILENFKKFLNTFTGANETARLLDADAVQKLADVVGKYVDRIQAETKSSKSTETSTETSTEKKSETKQSYSVPHTNLSSHADVVKASDETLVKEYDDLVSQVKKSGRNISKESTLKLYDIIRDIVYEYAGRKGYTSHLYHGSPTFGFTKIDMSRSGDKISFFAADDEGIASTYSGVFDTKQLNSVQRDPDKMSFKDIANLHQQIERKYGQPGDFVSANQYKNRSDYYSTAFKVAQSNISSALPNADKIFDSEERAALTRFIDADPRMLTLDDIENIYRILKSKSGLTGSLWNSVENVFPNILNIRYARNEGYEVFRNRVFSKDFLVAMIRASYGADGENLPIPGNYELLARTDGFMEVYAEGNYWNQIPTPKEMSAVTSKSRVNTRAIAKFAHDNGYPGAIIQAVTDSGGRSRADAFGDVYIFFNPNDVKSADLIVYDDKRKVIPLDKRFDSTQNELRYSVPHTDAAPTFYSQMGKVIEQQKANKFDARSLINMLLGKGVKAEEIKWSGIATFLEGKKSVTKEELVDFVNKSKLQIEETWLGKGEWNESPELFEAARENVRQAALENLENQFEIGMLKNLSEAINTMRIDYNAGAFTVTADLDGNEITFFKENPRINIARWGDREYNLSPYNYRELLFRLPGATYTNKAMKTHWGEKASGILAHARIGDAWLNNPPTDPDTGEAYPMLFIEEIQSDWDNARHKREMARKFYRQLTDLMTEAKQNPGFEKADKRIESIKKEFENMGLYIYVDDGYLLDNDIVPYRLEDLYGHVLLESDNETDIYDAIRTVIEKDIVRAGDIPDAPYGDGKYVEYTLKKLLRTAAEEGYTKIGWTTGKQQEERWSNKYSEAYRIEYDQQMPKFLNKYGKQWGATVSQEELSNGQMVWTFPINEAMRKSLIEIGQPLYSVKHMDKEYLELAKNPKKNQKRLGEMVEEAAKAAGYERFGDFYVDRKLNLKEPVPTKAQKRAFEMGKKYGNSETGLRSFLEDNESLYEQILIYNDALEHWYDAGAKGGEPEYRLAIRFGDVPDGRKSKNWATGEYERGVSAVNFLNDKTQNEKTIYDAIYGMQGIPKYIIGGWDFDIRGSDGEPLLVDAKNVIPFSEISKVKLADPVTYDDNGNVIPLSERFNTKTSDVRYSIKHIDEFSLSPRQYLAAAALETIRDPADREELRKIIDEYQTLDDTKTDLEHQIAKLLIRQDELNEELQEIQQTLSKTSAAKSRIVTDLINRYGSTREAMSTIRTELKSIEKQLKNLRSEQSKVTARLHDILTMPRVESIIEEQRQLVREYRNLYQSTKEADKIKLQELRERMNQKLRAEIDKRIEMRKKMVADYNERKKIDYYMPRIEATLKDLDKHLAKAPMPFRGPVLQFISMLDFRQRDKEGNVRLTRKSGNEVVPHQANLERERRLAEIEELLGKDEASYGDIENWFKAYGIELDEDLKTYITGVRNFLRNFVAANMVPVNMRAEDAAEIKSVYQFAKMLDRLLVIAAKGYTDVALDQSKNSREIAEHIEPLERKNTKVSRLESFMSVDNAQPETIFDRLGEGGKKLFNILANGADRYAINRQIISDFAADWDKKQVREWQNPKELVSVPFTTVDDEGNETVENVPMTPAQMMTLYATLQDPDGWRHIIDGEGFQLDRIKIGADGKKGEQVDTTRKMTEKDYNALVEKMNAYDPNLIPFADKLHKFISDQGREWGNQVSIGRYGFEQFTQPKYFPLFTVEKGKSNTIDAIYSAMRQSFYGLLNRSFTKERLPNAVNALIIGDFFDIFIEHMSDMALYNAYALPVLEVNRFLNYVEYDVEKDEKGNEHLVEQWKMKDKLDKAFGTDIIENYIKNVFDSINGQEYLSRSDSLFLMGLKLRNRVAVTANVRVIVQQFFSIIRAGEVIPSKYLLQGGYNFKETRDEMYRYAPVALWKKQGNYNTDIKLPLKEELIGAETGYKRFVNAVSEYGMTPAEFMDEVAWTRIWHGVTEWVKNTNPGLSGEAFYDECNKRFRDIIYRTQVVDSVLQKSQFMRQQTFQARVLSSFKGEPTTSYNQLLRVVDMYKDAKQRGDLKTAWATIRPLALRAITAYCLNAIANAVVTSLVDMIRDDDDYETMWEKFIEALFGEYRKNTRFWRDNMTFGERVGAFTRWFQSLLRSNLVESFNPLDIPLLSDIFSLLQGYDADRADLMIAEQAFDLMGGIIKSVDGMDTKLVYDLVGAVSQLFGLPVQNVMRDSLATWNSVVGIWNELFGTTLNMKVQITPESAQSGYEALYDAMSKGKESRTLELVTEIMDNVKDSDKAYNGITTQIRDAYKHNEITAEQAHDYLIAAYSYFDVHKKSYDTPAKLDKHIKDQVSGWDK